MYRHVTKRAMYITVWSSYFHSIHQKAQQAEYDYAYVLLLPREPGKREIHESRRLDNGVRIK